MFQLRDYQALAEFEIKQAWLSVANVLAVLPTGAGKTVLFAKILNDHNGAACAIAHRQELVSQISIALARFGVTHRIIAPQPLIRDIVQLHVEETGRSYYNPSANIAVAGVDTLKRRAHKMRKWCNSVTLWVTDEAHHVQVGNKWGDACELFPNAKGLGVTATPCRADGGGLGRHADGLFDTMIEGATMRQLIDRGFLTDYRVFAPPSDLDLEGVTITASGEMSKSQVKKRVERSHILGDVVEHYLKIAPGKLGVTFAVDVDTATEIAARFNAAGVPSEVVSAKTPVKERTAILKRFKNRQLLQLVNVDLFGEGFDLPAIEVVSMARPTQSYSLYVQQFGRALRLMDGKQWAIIIDHVGNVMRHGLPDRAQIWTLDRREKRSKRKHDPDLIPLKTCVNYELDGVDHQGCYGQFEAIHTACPYCGLPVVPAGRSTPKQVDGDLHELDASVLAAMRGEADKINNPLDLTYYPSDEKIRFSALKRHAQKQEAQRTLRNTIQWFGGYHDSLGIGRAESYKRFYWRFGIDVMSAQSLKTKEANELEVKIKEYLTSQDVMID